MHASRLATILLVALGAATAGAQPQPVTGRFVENLACATDPTQTYTLYLPSAYTAERQWPVLLVFDPRGRSVLAAELFRQAAEDFGWILVSSDNTRSDGPMEPNYRAIRALWPETFNHYSVDPRRIYAAGFSGGAMLGYYMGQNGGLAGVIGSGGRWPPDLSSEGLRFVHYGAAGDTDFNYLKMREIDDLFAKQGVAHRLAIFASRHSWMPQELAYEAVAWLELQAMRGQLRPADPALVERFFTADLARADALAATQPLEALRLYRSIAADYADLRPLDAVQATIATLAADPRIAELEKVESRWDDFERTYLIHNLPSVQALFDPESPPDQNQLRRLLEVPGLLKRAQADGWEGVTARRILETVYTQTTFYMTRDLMQRKLYRQAIAALEVGLEIRDDTWFPWYNLACSAARIRFKKRAFEALDRAVELGYQNAEHLRTDPDLESLRDDPRFAALVARMAGG